MQKLAEWRANESKELTHEPIKTLFISRLSYTAKEKHLKRELETYGQVKKVRIVTYKRTGKPKGYAFIEFEHKRDMNAA